MEGVSENTMKHTVEVTTAALAGSSRGVSDPDQIKNFITVIAKTIHKLYVSVPKD